MITACYTRTPLPERSTVARPTGSGATDASRANTIGGPRAAGEPLIPMNRFRTDDNGRERLPLPGVEIALR